MSLEGPIVGTVNGFDEGLREHRIVSAAGDNGAINVWRDDDGFFRAEAFRYMVTQDSKRFGAKKLALAWVRDWLPRIKGVS